MIDVSIASWQQKGERSSKPQTKRQKLESNILYNNIFKTSIILTSQKSLKPKTLSAPLCCSAGYNAPDPERRDGGEGHPTFSCSGPAGAAASREASIPAGVGGRPRRSRRSRRRRRSAAGSGEAAPGRQGGPAHPEQHQRVAAGGHGAGGAGAEGAKGTVQGLLQVIRGAC